MSGKNQDFNNVSNTRQKMKKIFFKLSFKIFQYYINDMTESEKRKNTEKYKFPENFPKRK